MSPTPTTSIPPRTKTNIYAAQASALVASAMVTFTIIKARTELKKKFYHKKVSRAPSLTRQRVDWQRFVEIHGNTSIFRRHIRMDYNSFIKLLGYLRPTLTTDSYMASFRGGAIIPEIRLFCVLRWLAGGAYTDILYFCGISKTSFYSVLWETISAINRTDDLRLHFPQTTEECLVAARGFRSISNREAIDTCVCAVDGYHLQIRVPSKKEVANVRSFYSGHYRTYGMNVQGACDHESRFVFLGVAGPGVLGDRDALFQCPLGAMIEQLPALISKGHSPPAMRPICLGLGYAVQGCAFDFVLHNIQADP